MSAKFLRRGAGSFFGRQSRNFKSQYISCVEAEQRDFRAECQTLNSNNILCAKFPRGGSRVIFGRQSSNFKSQYISCVEAELRDFRAEYQTLNSHNILCAEAELRN